MAAAREKRSKGKTPETVSAVHVRVQPFRLPQIRDGAVIGKEAPILRAPMTAILKIVTPEIFHAIDLEDDIIQSIIVREAVIRKIGWTAIERMVRRQIRPLMTKAEILTLTLDVEISMGETLFPPTR